MAKLYPKIWAMVGKLTKYWKQLGWEKPNTTKNLTNYKEKVAKYIVMSRRQTYVDNISNRFNPIIRSVLKDTEYIQFLHYDNFLEHAQQIGDLPMP